MNIPSSTSNPIPGQHGISLRQLVNGVMSDTLVAAILNKSIMINHVAADIYMTADKEKIVPVIKELLATIVSNAREGKIHINAERFADLLIIEIQDRNNYNGYALAYQIQSMEPDAGKIGGHLQMKGKNELVTTISLSFPDCRETEYVCQG